MFLTGSSEPLSSRAGQQTSRPHNEALSCWQPVPPQSKSPCSSRDHSGLACRAQRKESTQGTLSSSQQQPTLLTGQSQGQRVTLRSAPCTPQVHPAPSSRGLHGEDAQAAAVRGWPILPANHQLSTVPSSSFPGASWSPATGDTGQLSDAPPLWSRCFPRGSIFPQLPPDLSLPTFSSSMGNSP